jgi:hypothetical protein
VADFGAGRGQPGPGLYFDAALCILEVGRVAVGVHAVGLELRVVDLRGGGHQVARVDLAAAAEHDAVAVGDHHRAVGLDAALDLARPRLRVVHLVQHRPVFLLREGHRGVAPDVEGFPVQDGAVGRLLDGDDRAAVGVLLLRLTVERARVEPAGRQRIRVDLQAAIGQAIGHRGIVLRGAPCGFLRCLLRRDAACRQVQVAYRLLELHVGTLLLRQRPREAGRGQPVGQQAGGRGGGLRGTLGVEPRRAEGTLLRVHRHRGRAGRQCQRHRLRQRRNPEALRMHNHSALLAAVAVAMSHVCVHLTPSKE